MEGMGLKFTPVLGRHLLHYSSMFWPMADTSGTLILATLNCPDRGFNPNPYIVPPVILQWF